MLPAWKYALCAQKAGKTQPQRYPGKQTLLNEIMVVSKKKKKKENIGTFPLASVGYAESALISNSTDLPLLTQRSVWIKLKCFSFLHILFEKRTWRQNGKWNSKWWTLECYWIPYTVFWSVFWCNCHQLFYAVCCHIRLKHSSIIQGLEKLFVCYLKKIGKAKQTQGCQ